MDFLKVFPKIKVKMAVTRKLHIVKVALIKMSEDSGEQAQMVLWKNMALAIEIMVILLH